MPTKSTLKQHHYKGSAPRVLMILRSLALTLSMVLVVWISRWMCLEGKERNHVTLAPTPSSCVGNFVPYGSISDSSNCASPFQSVTSTVGKL